MFGLLHRMLQGKPRRYAKSKRFHVIGSYNPNAPIGSGPLIKGFASSASSPSASYLVAASAAALALALV